MEVLTITPFGGGGGGGDASVAGSDTQIQYNDGGSLGASADLTWDDTAKELGVGGDINLDDGGTFSTTVQSVTPTANRTISFPDATGTVALVSGSNGTIQYNDAGTLKGNSDFTVDPDWNDAAVTFTGLKLNVTDGAGGAPVGAAGSNLLDLQSGGTSKAKIDASGDYYGALYSFFGETNRVSIRYGGTRLLTIDQTGTRPGARVGSNSAFAWSSLANSEGNPDLSLYRDAADTLAQRRSTNAQTFRLYNTYTDASNYELGKLEWGSNVFRIGTEKGSAGGTSRALDMQTDGVSRLEIKDNGAGIYAKTSEYRFYANATGSYTGLVARFNSTSLKLEDGINISTGATTGTKIGTATTQKLGFYNATPVVQPTAVADATDAASAITQLNALLDRMRDLGLIAT